MGVCRLLPGVWRLLLVTPCDTVPSLRPHDVPQLWVSCWTAAIARTLDRLVTLVNHATANSLEGTFLGGCLFSGRTAARSAARSIA